MIYKESSYEDSAMREFRKQDRENNRRLIQSLVRNFEEFDDLHFEFSENGTRIWGRNADDIVVPINVTQSFLDSLPIEPAKFLGKLYFYSPEGCVDMDDGSRYRFSIRKCRNGNVTQLFIRVLPKDIPDMDELGYGAYKRTIDGVKDGLVLVSGTTGAGKSTVMASLIKGKVQLENNGIHVVTIEDPIEYLYPAPMHVSQRQVGNDAESFVSGLRAVLREDPDIIMVGEIRDGETADVAMTAAETGHLVFATVHSPGVSGSIRRMISLLGNEDYGALRLSQGLQSCIHVERSGRQRRLDVLNIDEALRSVIRERRLHQIESVAEQITRTDSLH